MGSTSNTQHTSNSITGLFVEKAQPHASRPGSFIGYVFEWLKEREFIVRQTPGTDIVLALFKTDGAVEVGFVESEYLNGDLLVISFPQVNFNAS
ncbi:hypothetical protein GCM10007047_21810 [Cerasicoccus arenae]|uniref:Uncharacterized protein n=1 Tax=Cerasicoccus arenae TaxID=424488 RepID=A0A8J3DI05_9BACT|nr:hypothetical protein [Cerasicoccus arenae]MBK1860064.1 hypothetical protein [Cerasicoccus arenae]GHC04594.1 hypothetical protein GCM10007047_21810 [Cerasicoccus arenae]